MTSYASKVGAASFTLFTLLILSMSFAGTVTVSWDANSENDLAGYNIYVGEAAETYTGVVDVGNSTEFKWNNLEDGKTYYFAVTAYDFSGNESDFSEEVSARPGGSDSNPPEIVNVVVQGETQLDINFSEPMNKDIAEDISNYVINGGISVLGTVLDANRVTVHLISSTHQRGQSYLLTVNNLEDINGNRIANGSSKSYVIPNPNGDSTPPQINNVVVVDANTLDVVFSEPVDTQTAGQKDNYDINNGVDIAQVSSTSSPSIVRLITTTHQNSQTYRLTVNKVRDLANNEIIANSSFSYDVNVSQNDNAPPKLSTLIVNGATQIDVTFDEPVEQSSAEKKNNYAISQGVEVLGAILNDDPRVVHLITSAHLDDQNYTLRVSNVRDRAENPNTIRPNSEMSYLFEKDGRINPGNGNGVSPQTFTLFQNYPNPFNPETEIRFFLEKQRGIELKVYNPLGQLVKTLVNENRPAGYHTVVWDGKNKKNRPVPSGIYVYSLEVKREEQRGDLLVQVSLERRVRRMTLLR